MVTRGIVERVLTPYAVKVRMPSINDMGLTGRNLMAEDLNDATICTLAHVDPSLQVGDIVFVAFEDNNMGKPVVIGHLYREDMKNTFIDIKSNSLQVNLNCKLPQHTSIGVITDTELSYLQGLNSNLQKQLDRLLTITNDLQLQIDKLKESGGNN